MRIITCARRLETWHCVLCVLVDEVFKMRQEKAAMLKVHIERAEKLSDSELGDLRADVKVSLSFVFCFLLCDALFGLFNKLRFCLRVWIYIGCLSFQRKWNEVWMKFDQGVLATIIMLICTVFTLCKPLYSYGFATFHAHKHSISQSFGI